MFHSFAQISKEGDIAVLPTKNVLKQPLRESTPKGLDSLVDDMERQKASKRMKATVDKEPVINIIPGRLNNISNHQDCFSNNTSKYQFTLSLVRCPKENIN